MTEGLNLPIAMKDDAELHANVRVLASYLIANPLACDSLEGMRCWWFDPEYQGPEHLIEKAVMWMMENQLVEELAGSDGRVRYRRTGSDAQLRRLLS